SPGEAGVGVAPMSTPPARCDLSSPLTTPSPRGLLFLNPELQLGHRFPPIPFMVEMVIRV
ncbi:MAG: hypothetical protein PVG90_03165, partial [Bacillota bacterium]